MPTFTSEAGAVVNGFVPQTPQLPAGDHTGKLLLMICSRQLVSTGPPPTPAGWTLIGSGTVAANRNPHLFARLGTGSDPNPEVAWAGGETTARCFVITSSSGFPANVLSTFVVQSLAEAAFNDNANYSALDSPAGGGLLVQAAGAARDISAASTNAVGVTSGWTQAVFNIHTTASGRFIAAQFRDAVSTTAAVSANTEALTPSPPWMDGGGLCVEFQANPDATGPTITSINGGQPINPRQTDVEIVGTGFGSPGSFTIGGIVTAFTSWSDTSILFNAPDIPFDTNYKPIGFNRNYPFVVTNSSSEASDPVNAQFTPAANTGFGEISPTQAPQSIFASSTYPAGTEFYGEFDVLPNGPQGNPGFDNAFEKDGSNRLTGAIKGLFDPSALVRWALYDTEWSGSAVTTFASQVVPPPEITGQIPDQRHIYGTAINLDLANYFSGTGIGYAVDQLPAGLTLTGSVISGNAAAVGQMQTIVTATNIGGSVMQSFNWDIYTLAALSVPGNLMIELAVGNAPINRNDLRITAWLGSASAVDDDGSTALAVSDDWNQTGTVGAGSYPVEFSAIATSLTLMQATRFIQIYNNGEAPVSGAARSSANLMIGVSV